MHRRPQLSTTGFEPYTRKQMGNAKARVTFRRRRVSLSETLLPLYRRSAECRAEPEPRKDRVHWFAASFTCTGAREYSGEYERTACDFPLLLIGLEARTTIVVLNWEMKVHHK